MKNCFLLIVLFFCVANSNAQSLKFNKDKHFTIVQFTDVHIVAPNEASLSSIKMISETLDTIKPDVVMLTGDIVTGKPARDGWKMVLEPIVKRKIPFVVLLGNHDHEQDISRKEIADIVLKSANNLNKKNKNGEIADMVLEIKSASSNKTEALLYCMDSHDYSKMDTVKGYGWFAFDQVKWYRAESEKYTQLNHGKPLPALAFFHIPLPEYKSAFENKSIKPIGDRLEDECPPDVNSGMFLSMLEKGDVLGTFTGHDHNNDYVTSLYGIALAYGRFSGSKNTYTDTQHGARIIQLKEGEKSFYTYIRLADGQIINKVNVPADFRK